MRGAGGCDARRRHALQRSLIIAFMFACDAVVNAGEAKRPMESSSGGGGRRGMRGAMGRTSTGCGASGRTRVCRTRGTSGSWSRLSEPQSGRTGLPGTRRVPASLSVCQTRPLVSSPPSASLHIHTVTHTHTHTSCTRSHTHTHTRSQSQSRLRLHTLSHTHTYLPTHPEAAPALPLMNVKPDLSIVHPLPRVCVLPKAGDAIGSAAAAPAAPPGGRRARGGGAGAAGPGRRHGRGDAEPPPAAGGAPRAGRPGRSGRVPFGAAHGGPRGPAQHHPRAPPRMDGYEQQRLLVLIPDGTTFNTISTVNVASVSPRC